MKNNLVIVSGRTNISLSKKISLKLNAELVIVDTKYFPNGEKRIKINTRLKGKKVIIVQSFRDSIDEKIVETLLICDAVQLLEPLEISLIIPRLPYSLQNKVFKNGEPLSVRVIAGVLSSLPLKRLILLDIHDQQSLDYFRCNTTNINSADLYYDYLKNKVSKGNWQLVIPDTGSVKRSMKLIRMLNLDMFKLTKFRDRLSGAVTIKKTTGEIKSHKLIVIDDGIITGRTCKKTADLISKINKQAEIVYLATHGILVDGAQEVIDKCNNISQVVITNSIPFKVVSKKIKVLDVSPVVAKIVLSD